ncbi:MAG TPA: NFACT family protein [Anaeromyxobacter sp.]|nr:NFACT family protein [Anaeromyxobacter sp.]
MSLTASEIDDLVRELAPLLGARISAAWVHGERALTIELAGREGGALLLVSAEADRTRIHAASHRPAQPASPFPFQAVLRREVVGARLSGMTSLAGDRVVTLRLERAKGPVELVAELTGRHGNIFLVGGDGVILASAGRNLSRRRRLLAGERYEPPRLPGPASGTSGLARPGRFTPQEGNPFPLSLAVEAEYDRREEERQLLEGRRRLREPMRAALARSVRALEKLAEEARRVPEAEEDRRAADLLKSHLHLVGRGAREVTVTEWTEEGPRQVRLALDPALTPQANMERYFRRYRRFVDSAARVTARADEVRKRQDALRALLGELEQASLAALPRLEKDARRLGAGPRRAATHRRRDEPAPPYRTFRSLPGVAILVGRGPAQNDFLTLRVARGNDLWLHARGKGGAHVVVRLERGRAPDQETLLDAAHLAAHFSGSRGESQVEVAYTRAKHVRKPRGSPPGAVTFSQERTLSLRFEPQRLERLFAEEEGEEASADDRPT